MRHVVFHIIFILSAVHTTTLDGQQYVSLFMSKVGTDALIAVEDESLIYEGDAAEDSLILIESNEGQDVRLEFIIHDGFNSLDDYLVSLKDPMSGDHFGYRVEGNEVRIDDIFGTVSLGITPGGIYALDVVRCGSFIYYVSENSVILCRELDNNAFQLNGHLQVTEAIDAAIDIAIESTLVCDFRCDTISEDFLALENFVKWREHVVTETAISFKYVEKYAIEEGENNAITCSLFSNADGTLVHSSTLNNIYGINLHRWDIPDSPEPLMTPGDEYVFQVTGMNKGHQYRIRIRYDE